MEVAGETGFKEDRVQSELGVQERHVAIEMSELFHTDVSLQEVSVVRGEGIRATRASECPTRSYLIMGNQIELMTGTSP